MENIRKSDKQELYQELAVFLLAKYRKKGRTKNK